MAAGDGVFPPGAARVFWVNPVADLWVMNLLEDVGGRVCGTEYLFCHALDAIPEDLPPMEALARMALADPMVGSPVDRAERIAADVDRFGAEAVVVSRIPGASHCALEGLVIDRWGRVASTFPSDNLPLGIVSSNELEGRPRVFTWEPESQLALCSDGLLEATNKDGDHSGNAI